MRVVRITYGATITFMVYILLLASSFQSVKAEDYVSKHFEWSYEGSTWKWDLSIPLYLYDMYRELVPQSERVKHGVEGYARLVTTYDSFIVEVAEGLDKVAKDKGYDYYDKVNFILVFVQSLPYVSDTGTTGYSEYPRFPIETLRDGGDCEDTSILFATLLKILNYDVILSSLPDHMAVGVRGDESYPWRYWWRTLSYYTYEGKRYYYCETTEGEPIMGVMPSKYKSVGATLISINEWEQFNPLGEIKRAINQTQSEINNAYFLSPEAISFLERAKSEYHLAESSYASKNYVGALNHAETAIYYLHQAREAENSYRQNLRKITNMNTPS